MTRQVVRKPAQAGFGKQLVSGSRARRTIKRTILGGGKMFSAVHN